MSEGKETLLLFNPGSGSGKAESWARWAARRLEEEGSRARLGMTAAQGPCVDLEGRPLVLNAQAWQGCWVFGGDGTLLNVVNRFEGSCCPLALFPTGTGNVVARDLGIPVGALAGRSAAYDIARKGPLVQMDLGLCNGSRFVFMVSAGLDARIVGEVHRSLQSRAALQVGTSTRPATRPWMPRLAYVPAILHQLEADAHGERFHLEVDGKVIGGVSFAAVLNAHHYGGPFVLCNEANAFDGVLHVVYLRDPIGPRKLAVAWAFLRRRMHELRDAGVLAAHRVVIRSAEVAQVDGDPLPASDLEIAIVPGALPIHRKQIPD